MYKVKVNGVEIEVSTAEEAVALTELAKKRATPVLKAPVPLVRPPPPPPEEVEVISEDRLEPISESEAFEQFKRALGRKLKYDRDYEAAPVESKKPHLEERLGDLPHIEGARVQPTASLDAARAVELAFRKHGRPVNKRDIKPFLMIPFHGISSISHRIAAAARYGLIKRVAAGVFVPKDYEAAPLEGLEQNERSMQGMAVSVVRFVADHPQDIGGDRAPRPWTRTSLSEAMSEKLGGKAGTHGVRAWAAKRLGWLDENYQLTEAGEEALTAPKEES